MNKNTFTVEPTEELKRWMIENDYSDPIYVAGFGWYAFKGFDVMPTALTWFSFKEINRQRIHPVVDLTEENL
jgi:hypothetical protein